MSAHRLIAPPMSEFDAVMLAAELLVRAFPRDRPARSAVYRSGVDCCLISHAAGMRLACYYAQGTLAFDAFHAGWDEGCAIWAKHLDEVNANRAAPGPATGPTLTIDLQRWAPPVTAGSESVPSSQRSWGEPVELVIVATPGGAA